MDGAAKPNLLGSLKQTKYLDELKTEGAKTIFRSGAVYRYPGTTPMAEVRGDHYEMGLQYGVLLRLEIERGLNSFNRILHWTAEKEKASPEGLLAHFVAQAKNIMSKLPPRYIREMEGIADATGLPFDMVAFSSLNYDVLMSMACTGVLMRTDKGGILHGRNNDTAGFGGEAFANLYVIVRHSAEGYHSVTHMDFPLFMGVETGYNDQGLTFSEETLTVRTPNPEGFSEPYLIRMVMEECGTIAELAPYFDRYPVVGAYGTVWSDRRTGEGLVAELTPWGWKPIEMTGPLLWNFNHLYSEELQTQQAARVNLNPDPDREAVATTFPQKDAYEVDDALDFIALQIGPDDLDYAHCGTRSPICNKAASQAVVFDADSDDFYMGTGVYYAARGNIYRYYDDFAKPPVLFRKSKPMRAAVVEVARIHNLLISPVDQRDAYIHLCDRFVDDPQVHFLVAHTSFLSKSLPEYTIYAEKAVQLAPEEEEYQLYVGLAAYQSGEYEKAIGILEDLILPDVLCKHEPARLYALQKSYAGYGDEKLASEYAAKLAQMLEAHDAVSFFDTGIKPYLDRAS